MSRKRMMYIGILASPLKLSFREHCRISAIVSMRQNSADQSKCELFSWRNDETAKVVQRAKTTFRANGVRYNDQQKGKIFPGSFWFWPMILTIMTDDRQMEVLWLWMRTILETSLLNFQSIGLPPQLGLAVHNDCLSAFFFFKYCLDTVPLLTVKSSGQVLVSKLRYQVQAH